MSHHLLTHIYPVQVHLYRPSIVPCSGSIPCLSLPLAFLTCLMYKAIHVKRPRPFCRPVVCICWLLLPCPDLLTREILVGVFGIRFLHPLAGCQEPWA